MSSDKPQPLAPGASQSGSNSLAEAPIAGNQSPPAGRSEALEREPVAEQANNSDQGPSATGVRQAPSPSATDVGSAEAWAKAIELLTRVIGPTTLVIGLMVYFGWVRTTYYYAAWGIPVSVLQPASQDYALGSIPPLIDLVKWGLIVAAAIVWAHFGLSWVLQRMPRLRSGLVALFAMAGIALLWTSYEVALPSVTTNIVWTAGIGCLSYCLWLAGSLSGGKRSTQTLATRAAQLWPSFQTWNRFLAAGLVIIGLFVTVAWQASAYGQAGVNQIVKCPAQLPAATIYSRDPLTLEAPNAVTVTQVSSDQQAYRFKYTGLRLLAHSAGKYFFITPVNTPSNNAITTTVLEDSSAIRIELTPGTSC